MTDRTLVILRHAKAERPSGMADIDRPLTGRGHADAAAAGAWLAAHGCVPEVVLCSPAKRTRQTWHGVAIALAEALSEQGGRGEPGAGGAPVVRYEPVLYSAGARELLEVVAATDPEVGSVLLIGHNPVVSTLSALLDPDAARDSDGLRTSGIAVHTVAGRWDELTTARAPLTATHTCRA